MPDVIPAHIPIASVNGRRRSSRTRRRPTTEMSMLIGESLHHASACARAHVTTECLALLYFTFSSLVSWTFRAAFLFLPPSLPPSFIVSLSTRNVISGWKYYANWCCRKPSEDVASSGVCSRPRDNRSSFIEWRINALALYKAVGNTCQRDSFSFDIFI